MHNVDLIQIHFIITFFLLNFQAISITQSGGPEEKLGLAFQLYDIDGNGHIEESEMNEIIKVSIHFFYHLTDSSEKLFKNGFPRN